MEALKAALVKEANATIGALQARNARLETRIAGLTRALARTGPVVRAQGRAIRAEARKEREAEVGEVVASLTGYYHTQMRLGAERKAALRAQIGLLEARIAAFEAQQAATTVLVVIEVRVRDCV